MNAPVPVAEPSAWQGTTLKERDWLVPTEGRVDADAVARAAQLLHHGAGLALIRGLDLAALTDVQCIEAGQALVAPLGRVRLYDPEHPGDSMVTAANQTVTSVTPAHAFRGDGDLYLHTDRAMSPGPPRLLGLLCIRPGHLGGESVLVSGHAVHNRLLTSRPEVLPALYRDFHFGTEPDIERTYPVFRSSGGRIHVHYNRYWITRSHQERGDPLSTAQVAALDAFDEAIADPRMAMHMRLERGDLLLLDNRAILHGRTSFVDPPHPQPGRCMARIWID